MVFSANKRGIPRKSIPPQSQDQTNVMTIDKQTNNNNNNNVAIQVLRYNMIARVLSATTNCSSCGK